MIWTIAKREIVTRARTTSFKVLTAILFLGVIAAAVAISTITGGDDEAAEEVTIGLIGEGAEYADAFAVPNEQFDAEIITIDNAQAAFDDGSIDVAFDGSTVIWEGFSWPSLDAYVRTTVTQSEFVERANDQGLAPTDLAELFAPVELEEERLDGSEDEQGVRIAAAMVSTVATLVLLQTWGSFLTMGVVEEKSSRVVEVLLSHIPARSLLTGKILGLGLLALFQMAILVSGVALALLLLQGIEVPDGVWNAVPILLITFVLGFGFYAAIFAAVGSTVSRQEDAQSAQLPVMLPLFVGYGIAIASISNPDSILLRIASFVPFTSPMVLPFRVALADPPLWEIAVALLVLAVSVPLVLRFAGAIYRTSLLKVGTRVPILEAIRSRSDG